MTYWNHNSHYHDLILRQLPHSFGAALDIGSGTGDFAIRLAKRAQRVDAVEMDAQAVSVARTRCAAFENITLVTNDFLSYSFVAEQYDVVTALASIHHMNLEQALMQAKRVLRPGGTLVILGLYRKSSAVDYGFDVASTLAHQFLAWRNRDNIAPVSGVAVRVQEPGEDFGRIQTTTNQILPNAKIQRRLLWRYTLVWKKPNA
ncbi:MAG: class I SAM-dependent methyltransferase [Candidatus Promineifilaceae bacterium]